MPAPPKKMGLSLYADLLDPGKDSGANIISSAPVKYELKQSSTEAPEAAQKKKDASLQFQPIKRPQAQQRGKARPTGNPSFPPSTHTTSSGALSTSLPEESSDRHDTIGQHPRPSKVSISNFEDWIGDEDEELQYQRPKYDKGRKKKKNKKQESRTWDWDDIYDPSLPNSYADYKGSDEQVRDIRDWKARLYYHRLKEVRRNEQRESEDAGRMRPLNAMFAPPSQYDFAPPSFDEDRPKRASTNNLVVDDSYQPGNIEAEKGTTTSHGDITGEDAYDRRMRMNDHGRSNDDFPASLAYSPRATPANPSSTGSNLDSFKSEEPIEASTAQKVSAQAKLAAMKAKLDAVRPPSTSNASMSDQLPLKDSSQPPSPPPPPPMEDPNSNPTISRAPIRYTVPPTTSRDIVAADFNGQVDNVRQDDAEILEKGEERRSTRPGQKGFAERLLKKYGWEKGQGLGAQGDGITTAIVAKAEKRKKRSDAEGGGWAAPKNMGKIIGGKRRKVESTEEDDGSYGQMSDVIKLEGMLRGLDVEYEIQEKNLLQEIGDEFGQKYGTVERLFIWREDMGGNDEVFVKFTSQLSALRAVNATDGMTFAGNDVLARFFDGEKFAKAVYI